jgi:hypothetical protein
MMINLKPNEDGWSCLDLPQTFNIFFRKGPLSTAGAMAKIISQASLVLPTYSRGVRDVRDAKSHKGKNVPERVDEAGASGTKSELRDQFKLLELSKKPQAVACLVGTHKDGTLNRLTFKNVVYASALRVSYGRAANLNTGWIYISVKICPLRCAQFAKIDVEHSNRRTISKFYEPPHAPASQGEPS